MGMALLGNRGEGHTMRGKDTPYVEKWRLLSIYPGQKKKQ